MDWRIALGFWLTVLWVSSGLIYLFGVVGWYEFVILPTADIGSFLEGAFAPLAFLWLVIGHFMQQKEIAANTQAINLQGESAQRLEMHSSRDSYFKLLALVQDQLGSIAGFQYISVTGPTGTGEITQDEFAEQRLNKDVTWFIGKMLVLASAHQMDSSKLQDIFFGTLIRARHSENFERTFNKLLNVAHSVDHDDMISNALLYGSAVGMLARVIEIVRTNKSLESFSGFGAPVISKKSPKRSKPQAAG